MNIGIYGSALGGITAELVDKAREVGEAVVSRNHTIIMGACPGLPYEAVLGAQKYAGGSARVIGFSPGVNLEDHVKRFEFPTEGITDFRFLPPNYSDVRKEVCLKTRNVSSVAESDAAIFISGRIGTLNELTIAYDLGINIGLVNGTGGVTGVALYLIEKLCKLSRSNMFYDSSPEKLVSQLEAVSS